MACDRSKELFKAESVTGGERGNVELLAACTGDLLIAAWAAIRPRQGSVGVMGQSLSMRSDLLFG